MKNINPPDIEPEAAFHSIIEKKSNKNIPIPVKK